MSKTNSVETNQVERVVKTDTDRIEFLEGLLSRKRKLTKKEFFLYTDIHIGGNGCSLYARSGIGSRIDFDGIGESVREAIDDTMDSQQKFLRL